MALVDFNKEFATADYKMDLKEAKEQLLKLRPKHPTRGEAVLNQKAIDIAIATMDAYENISDLVKDYLDEVM